MKRAFLAVTCILALTYCTGDTESGNGDRRYDSLVLDASYPHAFSYLSGVRELSDGTIFAADPTSQVLLRIDMANGTADTLGRKGAGPNEYNGPDRVFPLPGDSTLLVDLGNGRLTVIDPEGKFVEWAPITTPTEDGYGRSIRPSFVDAEGNVYAGGMNYRNDPSDSTTMYRVNRATREETRVVSTWHTPFARRQRGEKRPMLRPYDDWAVGSDGRVAVIRANGYSVDWHFPDGRVISGPPNEAETFPCGTPEQEAELENFVSNASYVMTEFSEDGVQSRSTQRGIPASAAPKLDDLGWPESLPVFTPGNTIISPAGEAWVKRMMPAGGPGRIEIFDDRGVRVGSLELPPRSKVIGFGATGDRVSTAYVTRKDDVGLIWLERYRLVAGRG